MEIKRFFCYSTLTIMAVFILLFSSCKKDDPVTPTVVEDARIYAKADNPLGKSVKTWAEDWSKFLLSQTCPEAAQLGVNKIPGQDQSMVFLSGTILTHGSANITIDHTNSIFVQLAFINYSNPTCDNNVFHPATGQDIDEFLKSTVSTIISGIDLQKMTLDGKDVTMIKTYRYQTAPFSVTPTTDIRNCGLICYPEGLLRTVTEGFFVVIKPLSVGNHTLSLYAKDVVFNVEFSSSFNITVI